MYENRCPKGFLSLGQSCRNVNFKNKVRHSCSCGTHSNWYSWSCRTYGQQGTKHETLVKKWKDLECLSIGYSRGNNGCISVHIVWDSKRKQARFSWRDVSIKGSLNVLKVCGDIEEKVWWEKDSDRKIPAFNGGRIYKQWACNNWVWEECRKAINIRKKRDN